MSRLFTVMLAIGLLLTAVACNAGDQKTDAKADAKTETKAEGKEYPAD